MNLSEKDKTASHQLIFLLVVLGILLTLVVYLSPPSADVSVSQISVEEVELVHVLLDKIQEDSPELRPMVERFRMSFSENPSVLSPSFFQSDVETQRTLLLKDVAVKGQTHDSEIAIVGE